MATKIRMRKKAAMKKVEQFWLVTVQVQDFKAGHRIYHATNLIDIHPALYLYEQNKEDKDGNTEYAMVLLNAIEVPAAMAKKLLAKDDFGEVAIWQT